MVIILWLQSPWQRDEVQQRCREPSETTYFVYRRGAIQLLRPSSVTFFFLFYLFFFVRPTLDESTGPLLLSSSSSFQEPILALYAGTVLKRRQRFLSDFSISSRVTLLLPAVTAKFLASSNDCSSISSRTIERMVSAFFEMIYAWSVYRKVRRKIEKFCEIRVIWILRVKCI